MTNKHLSPARNLRRVIVRCCGTCQYGKYDNGWFLCSRENGLETDAGDKLEYIHVCDLWRKYEHKVKSKEG